MSPSPEQLSFEILERFRAALKTAGAPLASAIDPGLSDEQIDDVAAELGMAVPPELRTLWRWGCPADSAGDQEAGWDVNARFELWPPSYAVVATRHYQGWYEPLPAHIAFAGPPQSSCLLVRGDDTAPTSPVIAAYIDDPDTSDAAPSLGALFQLWTEQLAGGEYKFIGDEWHPLDDPLPQPYVRGD